MSVQVSSLVWLIEFPSPGKKLVALYLADCADDLGRCWPANKTIASRCGLSRDTVKEVVAELEGMGIIGREPQFRRDGSQASSITRFDIPRLETMAAERRRDLIREAAEDKALASGGGGGRKNTPGGEGEKTPPPVLEQPDQSATQPKASDGVGEVKKTSPRGRGEKATGGRGENPPGGRVEILAGGGGKTSPGEGGKPHPLEPSRNRQRTGAPCSPPAGDADHRASALVKGVVQGFAVVFQRRFKRPYIPDPKKDTRAAQALLAAGLEPATIAGRFEEATRARGFWCSKVTTLPMLAERWNEIGGELANQGGAGATMGGKADGQETADEWKASIEKPPTP